jgi:hypothetical protein
MQCAGLMAPRVSFWHNPNTKAIAEHGQGEVLINSAKEKERADTPGNLVQLSPMLGYTHFTNWGFLADGSVPYVVGNLVDAIATSLVAPVDGAR